MSDININGIPNMGFQGGGGGYFVPQGSGLANAYASQGQVNNYLGNLNNTVTQPAFDPFAQSGGFGTMTDYYSSLGAAYGRATGGFGGQKISNPQALSKFGNELFDADFYKSQNPDVAAAGVDPTAHWFEYGQKEGRTVRTFNPYQYQQANPDVWSAGADPYQHYKQYGITEGRTGAWSDYNPTDYLNLNPDVKAAGVDPTAHWFEYGEKEGRKGSLSPLNSYQGTGFDAFDPNIYGGSHPTAGFGQQPTAAADPQNWQDLWNERGPFNRSSDATGRDALAADYYAANRDVYDAARGSGQNFTDFALNHLKAYGDDEGRGFFDEQGYLQQNPDVAAAGMDPTAHWFQFGQKEGRASPTANFNYGEYLAQNPDVLSAGMDPMAHWLQFGANEKRQGALGNLTNTLVDQRKGFAELARSDPNLMFKLASKAYQEDQNSPEGRTAVIEAMLNRMNATGQNPLNPAYYPRDKAVYNANIEQKMRDNPALLQQVIGEIEQAFGGSNIAKYGTNWSSGDTWDYEKQFVTPTQAMGANQFYIKNLNTPDASGKSWAGPGIVNQNTRWLNRVTGNTVTGN